MKQVTLKSGARGYQCKLRTSYANFAEFKAYSEVYNIHGRLGFKSIAGAWRVNPTIQGGVNPADLRRVKKPI